MNTTTGATPAEPGAGAAGTGREALTAGLVAANLCFLPWAFGGVDPWAQLVSAALALAALASALGPDRAERWQRLRRLPGFWPGLALLGFIAVQALNPAFDFRSDDRAWWLVPRPHWSWLPSGVAAPFALQNPLRTLVTAGACGLVAAAVWTGVTRRPLAAAILAAVAVNAFLFAIFGLLQRAAGATAIYGLRPAHDYFFAALIYKNHAAAYFSLATAVTLGLVLHARQRRGVSERRAGAPLLFGLFAAAGLLALALTFSAAGLALFALVAAGTWYGLRRRAPHRPAVAGGIWLAGTATAGAATLAVALLVAGPEAQARAGKWAGGELTESARLRLLAARQGWEMFGDRWAYGWGAGSFRHTFTKYQRDVPDLARWQGFELRWEHVHNDGLEILIELGAIGAALALAVAAAWVRFLVRSQVWLRSEAAPLLGGLAALAVHSLLDFPLQLPAIALLGAALPPLLVRWSGLPDRTSASP
jgi:hypothetical protein